MLPHARRKLLDHLLGVKFLGVDADAVIQIVRLGALKPNRFTGHDSILALRWVPDEADKHFILATTGRFCENRPECCFFKPDHAFALIRAPVVVVHRSHAHA
jgi:hypothetical protein